MKSAAALAVLGVILGGCAGARTPPGEPPPAPALAEIQRGGDTWVGKRLVFHGRFEGWSACPGPSRARSRSDWVFTEDGACMYVTGGLPAGYDPRGDRGRPCRFVGTVERADGAWLIHWWGEAP